MLTTGVKTTKEAVIWLFFEVGASGGNTLENGFREALESLSLASRALDFSVVLWYHICN